MESELKPEYVEKARKIMKEEPVPVGTPEGLKKLMG